MNPALFEKEERFTPSWLADKGKRICEDTAALAENGWFISNWETPLSLLHAAARDLRQNRTDRGDALMARHFRDILPTIERQASELFLERALILKKAFAAHQAGDFELSIPVILAQADGVGHEVFGVSPYSRHQGKISMLSDFVRKLRISEDEADYFKIVTHLLPMNAGPIERSQYSSPLNRHLVLHGISTAYATEINGLKASAWLQFIVSFRQQEIFDASRSRGEL